MTTLQAEIATRVSGFFTDYTKRVEYRTKCLDGLEYDEYEGGEKFTQEEAEERDYAKRLLESLQKIESLISVNSFKEAVSITIKVISEKLTKEQLTKPEYKELVMITPESEGEAVEVLEFLTRYLSEVYTPET